MLPEKLIPPARVLFDVCLISLAGCATLTPRADDATPVTSVSSVAAPSVDSRGIDSVPRLLAIGDRVIARQNERDLEGTVARLTPGHVVIAIDSARIEVRSADLSRLQLAVGRGGYGYTGATIGMLVTVPVYSLLTAGLGAAIGAPISQPIWADMVPGPRLRITTDTDTFVGTITARRADSIGLTRDSSHVVRRVAIAEIRRVQISSVHDRAGPAGLLGGLFGGAAGLITGYRNAQRISREHPCDIGCAAVALLGGWVGQGVGILVGRNIGSRIHVEDWYDLAVVRLRW